MLQGGCLYGAVRWTAEGTPKVVHYCDCSSAGDGPQHRSPPWPGSGATPCSGRGRQPLSGHRASRCALTAAPAAHRCRSPRRKDDVALAVGTFDQPEAVTPTHNFAAESRVAWVEIGPGCPTRRRGSDDDRSEPPFPQNPIGRRRFHLIGEALAIKGHQGIVGVVPRAAQGVAPAARRESPGRPPP